MTGDDQTAVPRPPDRPTDAVAAPAGAGEVFGPYQLIELLGRGAMGEVWRAFDTRRERMVALKRLSSDWAHAGAFQARFRREARATAQLSSEHVIVIHDYGDIDGRLFIDMRLVPGGDLAELLAGRPGGIAPAMAVDLCAQIADGLRAAHRAQVIHRDVKPSNVLLAPDTHGPRVYLVDFGIAKLADELTGAGITATGTTMGTPAYMAPELFEPAGDASVASDVYALGCVLFEMLTGRKVFGATTQLALMNQHAHHPPPAPSDRRPDLVAFDAVVARALAKDPSRRHPTPVDLALDARAALGAAGGRPAHAVDAVGAVEGHRPPPRRPHRRALLAGAAAVVVAIAVGLVAWFSATGTTTEAATPGVPQRLPVSLQTPTGLAFSPDGARAYVADNGANTLTIVDTATAATVASVPVGFGPSAVALSPDGRRAYVTDSGSPTALEDGVSVVDTATATTTGTIRVAPGPSGLALSPDGRTAYVVSYGSDAAPGTTLSFVDTVRGTVAATVPVGTGPLRVATGPGGSQLYVPLFGHTAAAGSTLAVVDVATRVPTTVPTGDAAPATVLPSPDGKAVYVVCYGSTASPGSVQVLDTTTHTMRPLNRDPVDSAIGGALSPDGRLVVAPEWGTDDRPGSAVALVDTATGTTRKVPFPARPLEAAVAPDGRSIWIAADPGGLWRIPLDAG